MFEDRDNNFKIKIFSGCLANESLVIFGRFGSLFTALFQLLKRSWRPKSF